LRPHSSFFLRGEFRPIFLLGRFPFFLSEGYTRVYVPPFFGGPWPGISPHRGFPGQIVLGRSALLFGISVGPVTRVVWGGAYKSNIFRVPKPGVFGPYFFHKYVASSQYPGGDRGEIICAPLFLHSCGCPPRFYTLPPGGVCQHFFNLGGGDTTNSFCGYRAPSGG